MHDGALPHFFQCWRPPEPDFWCTVDRKKTSRQWSAQLTQILWILFVWEHLKNSEYSAPVNDTEVLQQLAANVCQTIHMKSGTFNRICTSAQQKA